MTLGTALAERIAQPEAGSIAPSCARLLSPVNRADLPLPCTLSSGSFRTPARPEQETVRGGPRDDPAVCPREVPRRRQPGKPHAVISRFARRVAAAKPPQSQGEPPSTPRRSDTGTIRLHFSVVAAAQPPRALPLSVLTGPKEKAGARPIGVSG
jgi:hypothetical protein